MWQSYFMMLMKFGQTKKTKSLKRNLQVYAHLEKIQGNLVDYWRYWQQKKNKSIKRQDEKRLV
jgi:hypothetical protein